MFIELHAIAATYGTSTWKPSQGTNLYCLVNRGTLVWTTCPRSLPDNAAAGSWTCDLPITSPSNMIATTPPSHHLRIIRVIGKGQQDVLTPPGRPQWIMTYHPITSVWKMPPSWLSWHCTGHSGTYWQQMELHTEMVQAKQLNNDNDDI